MFPSLFGHSDSPLKQRVLGSVLQQLDRLLQPPPTSLELLRPRPIRRRQRLLSPHGTPENVSHPMPQ